MVAASPADVGVPEPSFGDVPTHPEKVLDTLLNVLYPNKAGELARVIGVRRTTVHHHRSGFTSLTPEKIRSYAVAFNVPEGLFFLRPSEVLVWIGTVHPEWVDS